MGTMIHGYDETRDKRVLTDTDGKLRVVIERSGDVTRDYYCADSTITAMSMSTITIGTEVVNRQWEINDVNVSTSTSFLFRVDILLGGTRVGTRWGDVNIHISPKDASIRPVFLNEAFQIRIWNYDNVAHTFHIEQFGNRRASI